MLGLGILKIVPFFASNVEDTKLLVNDVYRDSSSTHFFPLKPNSFTTLVKTSCLVPQYARPYYPSQIHQSHRAAFPVWFSQHHIGNHSKPNVAGPPRLEEIYQRHGHLCLQAKRQEAADKEKGWADLGKGTLQIHPDSSSTPRYSSTTTARPPSLLACHTERKPVIPVEIIS